MKSERKRKAAGDVLGLEGGGTKTTWVLLNGAGDILRRGRAGAGNGQHLTEAQVLSLFRQIRQAARGNVRAIGGAFAGCHLPRERARLERLLKKVWPQAEAIVVGGDTHSAMAGAHGQGDGIIVIAGTGANVVGRRGSRWEKASGWGPIFSDEGSGYDVARRGLQAVYRHYAATQELTGLGREYLRTTAQNSLEDLVPWILARPGKTEVSALAPCVFRAAHRGDTLARRVLAEGLEELAERVFFVARRLKLRQPQIGLVGSLFEKHPDYVQGFRRAVRKRCAGAKLWVSKTPGEVSAAMMVSDAPKPIQPESGSAAVAPVIPYSEALTEQRNPRSRGLDQMTVGQMVQLFVLEENKVEVALHLSVAAITRACELVAEVIAGGGRVVYVGAGTSGRLGVVDASEMPPTFNADPEMFQAVIAGGAAAVFASQEGAEDDEVAGAEALRQRGVTARDVVVGIAASGTTPFVLGALRYARTKKAATILLTCNPQRTRLVPVDVAMDIPVGPELVTGSTRLKAGTATKLVLNMLSTIAMVRAGRVKDNLMVAVQATNQKLKDRAKRLVMTLTDCSEAEAISRLQQAQWDVRKAIAA